MTTFNIHTPRDSSTSFQSLEVHQLFVMYNDYTNVYIKLEGNRASAINAPTRATRAVENNQRVIRVSHIEAYIDGAAIPIKEREGN